jgi:L,D-peptidoglycan transpeptidase YkuD (ErfK/YbiS/YcfS/YnhG family)
MLVLALVSCGNAAADDACPAALAVATRLVLVVVPDMRSVAATVRRFERNAPGANWHEIGTAAPAVVGKAGLGWGWTFAGDAEPGEPVKREGDMRAPAGFYPLGRPFGLAPAGFPAYLRLQPEESFCVDDPGSPAYGAIVPRAAAGRAASGEEMWKVPLYRYGLVVDYPANRAAKGGSCVFVHVWRSPQSGTAGCVALAEDGVKALQAWAKPGTAAIGILPGAAVPRFAACLKGVSPPA